jgi:hypothetical protein
MPTPTYTSLATVTLAGTANSVTFSSIPATYRDLVLVFDGFTTSTNVGGYLQYNGDTANNYSFVAVFGTGSSASSDQNNTTNSSIFNFTTTTSKSTSVVHIMDYSATDKHKTAVSKSGQADGYVLAYASRWANTAAITSVLVSVNGGNYAAGSTFSLYGIVS